MVGSGCVDLGSEAGAVVGLVHQVGLAGIRVQQIDQAVIHGGRHAAADAGHVGHLGCRRPQLAVIDPVIEGLVDRIYRLVLKTTAAGVLLIQVFPGIGTSPLQASPLKTFVKNCGLFPTPLCRENNQLFILEIPHGDETPPLIIGVDWIDVRRIDWNELIVRLRPSCSTSDSPTVV
ncbi:hypothetical protein ACVIHH_003359 [Bradyrhizobium sp. USDA 4518]